ncbi:17295_t:CDS:2 [Dentiscutata heterogama]|uniref:17295_t:CDS:1 n=1 Tax=Dentiscutata heterogama TaxID=1316150 RepID=A0ACA9K361_9GLOM|nr:17295_t:CDS:2 [Dentiscutata heterogama]
MNIHRLLDNSEEVYSSVVFNKEFDEDNNQEYINQETPENKNVGPDFIFSGNLSAYDYFASRDNRNSSGHTLSTLTSFIRPYEFSPLSPPTNSKEKNIYYEPRERLLLDGAELWSQFYRVENEMIITKSGRCMFPLLKYKPVNLDPSAKYSFIVDFIQVSPTRFRFKKGSWVSIGIDKRKFSLNNLGNRNGRIKTGMVGGRPFTHPDSPQSGAYWMDSGVNFPKIKLTNRPCHNNQSKSKKRGRPRNSGPNNSSSLPDGHFCLTSFHKYQPRVKMIKHATDINDHDQEIITAFEETTFIAVTHYQNDAVNSLKKNYNPHAKGFKDMDSKDLDCDQLYYSDETEISDNESQNEFDSDFDRADENDNLRNKIRLDNDSFFKSTSSSGSMDLLTSEKSGTATKKIRPNFTRHVSAEEIRTRQTGIYHSNNRTKVTKYTSKDQYAISENIIPNHETHNWLDLNISSNLKNTSSKHRPKLDKSISIPSFKFFDPFNKSLITPISPHKIDQQPTATGFPWITKHTHNEYGRDTNMTQRQYKLNAFQPKDGSKDESDDELPQRCAPHQNTPQWAFPVTPPTPISPNGKGFTTSPPINPYLSRLERAENENMKLREFIRERYGIEAEKEADAVVALGRNS